MTPEQTALLARLDGKECKQCPNGTARMYETDCGFPDCYPDYDDERDLMPLAWKYRLDIDWIPCEDESLICTVYSNIILKDKSEFSDKDPKIAIQQALLSIAREKYGE